jgi:predicted RNase H-like nuclease (RuvC/YqgF family)
MSELNQHEQSQNQRIKELEEEVAGLRRAFAELSESVEDRCMAAIEMLASAVGGVIGSARAKVKAKQEAPKFEIRLVDGLTEVANRESFQVTLQDNGGVLVAQDKANSGKWTALPSTALEETFVAFLKGHQIPVGQPTLINLYQLNYS